MVYDKDDGKDHAKQIEKYTFELFSGEGMKVLFWSDFDFTLAESTQVMPFALYLAIKANSLPLFARQVSPH